MKVTALQSNKRYRVKDVIDFLCSSAVFWDLLLCFFLVWIFYTKYKMILIWFLIISWMILHFFSRYVCIPCPVCDHLNMSGVHCHSLHNLQIQVVSPKLHSDFRLLSASNRINKNVNGSNWQVWAGLFYCRGVDTMRRR